MFCHLILSHLVVAMNSSSRSNHFLLSNTKRLPNYFCGDGYGYESMRTLVERSVLLLSFACSLCYICYLNIYHYTVNISQLDSEMG